MNLVIYLSAAIAVTATGLVITRPNPMHALLYLVISFLAISLIFFSLGAPFIAALEVIVYAGAIMVLFSFAMMLLNVGTQIERRAFSRRDYGWVGPVILSLFLLAELVYLLVSGTTRPAAGQLELSNAVITPAQVSFTLFTTYLLGVEMASLLLLSSVVGAFYLGQSHREERQVRRKQVATWKERAVDEEAPEPASEAQKEAEEH